ncbi:hypothetical protein EG68_00844 [Paragonimus skrjabini miyazakii]|uniref:Uncharacterized protein n=1 Tax=Paragonimus skrjabini miyazakii TaxID=59628 RepID=A0A8S9Z5J3_9TREM|nr:hypothetical protein EG68_00844 [Paragonimus skrjabini miyazakii]
MDHFNCNFLLLFAVFSPCESNPNEIDVVRVHLPKYRPHPLPIHSPIPSELREKLLPTCRPIFEVTRNDPPTGNYCMVTHALSIRNKIHGEGQSELLYSSIQPSTTQPIKQGVDSGISNTSADTFSLSDVGQPNVFVPSGPKTVLKGTTILEPKQINHPRLYAPEITSGASEEARTLCYGNTKFKWSKHAQPSVISSSSKTSITSSIETSSNEIYRSEPIGDSSESGSATSVQDKKTDEIELTAFRTLLNQMPASKFRYRNGGTKKSMDLGLRIRIMKLLSLFHVITLVTFALSIVMNDKKTIGVLRFPLEALLVYLYAGSIIFILLVGINHLLIRHGFIDEKCVSVQLRSQQQLELQPAAIQSNVPKSFSSSRGKLYVQREKRDYCGSRRQSNNCMTTSHDMDIMNNTENLISSQACPKELDEVRGKGRKHCLFHLTCVLVVIGTLGHGLAGMVFHGISNCVTLNSTGAPTNVLYQNSLSIQFNAGELCVHNHTDRTQLVSSSPGILSTVRTRHGLFLGLIVLELPFLNRSPHLQSRLPWLQAFGYVHLATTNLIAWITNSVIDVTDENLLPPCGDNYSVIVTNGSENAFHCRLDWWLTSLEAIWSLSSMFSSQYHIIAICYLWILWNQCWIHQLDGTKPQHGQSTGIGQKRSVRWLYTSTTGLNASLTHSRSVPPFCTGGSDRQQRLKTMRVFHPPISYSAVVPILFGLFLLLTSILIILCTSMIEPLSHAIGYWIRITWAAIVASLTICLELYYKRRIFISTTKSTVIMVCTEIRGSLLDPLILFTFIGSLMFHSHPIFVLICSLLIPHRFPYSSSIVIALIHGVLLFDTIFQYLILIEIALISSTRTYWYQKLQSFFKLLTFLNMSILIMIPAILNKVDIPNLTMSSVIHQQFAYPMFLLYRALTMISIADIIRV